MNKAALAAMLPLLAALAASAAPAPFDPAARAREIAPFIDAQTVAVAHVDVSRVDVEAAFARLVRIADLSKSPDAREIARVKTLAAEWASQFLAAGGRDIYVVVSLADIPPVPFLVVVPLRDGADERAIRALLYSGRADGPTERAPEPGRRGRPNTEVAVVGNAVVGVSSVILDRVRKMTPDPRPELADAFAAAGDTAAQLLILPTADNRRVIEELLPELPKEIGGGASTIVTQGLMWAAIGIDAPPNTSIRLTIQSRNADAAEAMGRWLQVFLKTLVNTREVSKALPGFDQVTGALTPTVTGDRLTLILDREKIDRLLDGVVASAIRRERGIRRQRDGFNSIRQALQHYRKTHDGASPPDLQTLIEAKLIGREDIISPDTGRTYAYIRPPKDARGQTAVVYDDLAPAKGQRTGVLFLDGHISILPMDKAFDRLIAEARAASEKAYAPQR